GGGRRPEHVSECLQGSPAGCGAASATSLAPRDRKESFPQAPSRAGECSATGPARPGVAGGAGTELRTDSGRDSLGARAIGPKATRCADPPRGPWALVRRAEGPSGARALRAPGSAVPGAGLIAGGARSTRGADLVRAC